MALFSLDEEAEESPEAGPGVISARTTGWVAQRLMRGDKLYQAEYRRCGKKRCRCMKSSQNVDWHGPYWFCYETKRKGGGDCRTTGGWKRTYLGREEAEALGLTSPVRRPRK